MYEPLYPREDLEIAAALAQSTTELVALLGREPTPGRNRHVLKLLRHYDIEHGHLKKTGHVYTKAMLAEAASVSDSINDVLRCLDIPLTGGSQAHIGRRLRAYDIDMSHFKTSGDSHEFDLDAVLDAIDGAQTIVEVARRLAGATDNATYERVRRDLRRHGITAATLREQHTGRPLAAISAEEFSAAVASSQSIAECSRRLATGTTGAFYRYFRAATLALGLDTSHMTGQGHYRGRPSPQRIPAADILVKDPTLEGRVKSARLRRALIDIGTPYVCARCGTGPEWQGDTMTLEVDHISGDFTDNRPENLRVLCPNCHATTATFCRKKGSLAPDRSAGSLGQA